VTTAVPDLVSEVAVIVAVPAPMAVTTPVTLTMATALFELLHVIRRPVSMVFAASRVTAVACVVPPTATDVAAKATPDGYTLLMVTISTHGISPALYPKLPYDPQKDFAPIANIGLTPQVLMTSLKSGINSVADLVDFVVARICDQIGVPNTLVRRWGSA
jgi:hypothetical protein